MRTMLLLTLLSSACGGSAFTADLTRPDASPPEEASAPDAQTDGGMPEPDGGGGQDAAVDGEGGQAEAGHACVSDLSGVGSGDFQITLSIRTTTTQTASVLGQRGVCGTSAFWQIQTSASGGLTVETDDGTAAGDTLVASLARVNDGVTHRVTVARLAGVLSTTIDGAASGATADVDSIGSLSPLRVGTSVCDGVAGVVSLIGSVTDVCLTR
jgi:hypothetical protein